MTKRNSNGVASSIDTYRTVKGIRYIAWRYDAVDDALRAYRRAGVRCRKFVGEVFIDPADTDKAVAVDAAIASPSKPPAEDDLTEIETFLSGHPARACFFPIDADRLAVFTRRCIQEIRATRAAAQAQPLTSPTGEQLYAMVTGRFDNGSTAWEICSESGKRAWQAAAADLLLSPDTILAKASAVSQTTAQPEINNQAFITWWHSLPQIVGRSPIGAAFAAWQARSAAQPSFLWKVIALDAIKRMRAAHVGCMDIIHQAESLLKSEHERVSAHPDDTLDGAALTEGKPDTYRRDNESFSKLAVFRRTFMECSHLPVDQAIVEALAAVQKMREIQS